MKRGDPEVTGNEEKVECSRYHPGAKRKQAVENSPLGRPFAFTSGVSSSEELIF